MYELMAAAVRTGNGISLNSVHDTASKLDEQEFCGIQAIGIAKKRADLRVAGGLTKNSVGRGTRDLSRLSFSSTPEISRLMKSRNCFFSGG
jgi:hypothetical protein